MDRTRGIHVNFMEHSRTRGIHVMVEPIREKHGFHVMVEQTVQGAFATRAELTPTRHAVVVTRLRKRRAGGKGAEVRRVFGVSRNVVYRMLNTPDPAPGGWKEDVIRYIS